MSQTAETMEFPEFFRIQCNNSHMCLVRNSAPGSFSLVPPNQCDWTYELTELSKTRWRVIGRKTDPLAVMVGEEEMVVEHNFTLAEGGRWELHRGG